MLSYIDVICILFTVALLFIEGHRGSLFALVDFALASSAVLLAHAFYVPLSTHVGSYTAAYLLILLGVLLITVVLATFLSLRLKVPVSGWYAAGGGVLGICTALVLSYALYEYIVIRYGWGTALLNDTLLAWQFRDNAALHALSGFILTLMGRQ